MPTTFNWIYLGIPTNTSGGTIFIDPTEGNNIAENAGTGTGGLLNATTGQRNFGSAGSPLYDQIATATMINNGGNTTALDQNNQAANDQFTTVRGGTTLTRTFDASVSYNATVTYADGTTATTTVVVAQATNGELYLTPTVTGGAANPALTAKPITSLTLNSVVTNEVTGLGIDRQQIGWDDGIIEGTSGNDSIGAGYVEPVGNGSDQIDGGDGTSSAATGWNDDVIRAGAGDDTINGGLGNDSIDAGTGNDQIQLTGTYGNDTIDGGTGTDTLTGATLTGAATVTFNNGTGTFNSAAGNATFSNIEAVTTGSGADTVTITGTTAGTFNTGDGADVINAGGSGADTIDAGAGNDTVNLTGTFGNDSITGGAGSDTLSGATLTGPTTVTFNNGSGTLANGASTASYNTFEAVTTGAGADTVTITGTTAGTFNTGDGADVINAGGSGADTIDAGAGNDAINLGTSYGNDSITGGAGSDTLSGATFPGSQPATVTYADGAGTFASSGGNATFNTIEVIETGAGNDVVNAAGNTNAATFSTGAGNDTITGGQGAETINAGDGNDVVSAGGGNDFVSGGAGNDNLDGGDGNDTLDGGADADTLTGGAGNDRFIVTSGDVITDFGIGNTGAVNDGNPNNNDFVDLSAYYNDANLAIVNAQRVADGLRPYDTPLGWMRADQADDGVLNSITTAGGFSQDFTLTIANGGNPVGVTALAEDSVGVVCFAADVLIDTVDGPVRAADLTVGTMVMTRDEGLQPLRWIAQRHLDAATLTAEPRLRPIRILKGALGDGRPTSDLVVSPQHRILVRSRIAQRMFGTDEVLVAAKHLCLLEGIDIATDLHEVTYVHFLFDAHQIVTSNGAETESLFTGAEALKSVGEAARDEIFTLFPDLRDGASFPAARYLAPGKMARKLVDRHVQNNKTLVSQRAAS